MKIAMIGTGYVGLVSGACFAEFGPDVTCVDVDAAKIARLLNGEIPIYEPGLHDLVAKGIQSGRLSFTTDLAHAVSEADAVFIAVGTPSRRGDGHADLRYVEAAAIEVAKSLKGYTVVVTKSTVPVGTGRRVAELMDFIKHNDWLFARAVEEVRVLDAIFDRWQVAVDIERVAHISGQRGFARTANSAQPYNRGLLPRILNSRLPKRSVKHASILYILVFYLQVTIARGV